VIVEIITFFPLIVLVTLFKKTKSRHNRLTQFKKMLQKENNADSEIKILNMNSINFKKKKCLNVLGLSK
jgi:hypothetical protein